MSDDRLADELAGIRERASQITGDGHKLADCVADLGGPCSGHDAERLADAIAALLAEHQPVDRRRVRPCCEGCEANADWTLCVYWAHCPVRETVAKHLLGKDGDR